MTAAPMVGPHKLAWTRKLDDPFERRFNDRRPFVYPVGNTLSIVHQGHILGFDQTSGKDIYDFTMAPFELPVQSHDAPPDGIYLVDRHVAQDYFKGLHGKPATQPIDEAALAPALARFDLEKGKVRWSLKLTLKESYHAVVESIDPRGETTSNYFDPEKGVLLEKTPAWALQSSDGLFPIPSHPTEFDIGGNHFQFKLAWSTRGDQPHLPNPAGTIDCFSSDHKQRWTVQLPWTSDDYTGIDYGITIKPAGKDYLAIFWYDWRN